MTSQKKFLIWFFLVSIAVVIALAPLASPLPDGLEKVAETYGFSGKAVNYPFKVLFSDYGASKINSPFVSTVISGIFGIALTAALASGLGLILNYTKRRVEKD